jgi:ABC-type glycerol-3-phosphate transport system substrate-binding protein
MLTKRWIATFVAVVAILSLLAACGPTPTPEVVKEVVKETVVVEKEVEVTKVIEVEKVVEVTPEPEPEEVSMVYITAGDVNMLALGQNVLAPDFHEMYPNVTAAVVHTGPGDAGSRLIFEKLLADKEAGKDPGDVDVAMVHQKFMSWAMEDGRGCQERPGNRHRRVRHAHVPQPDRPRLQPGRSP